MTIDGVVIVSGGLDSVTLLHYLVKKKGRRPAVITFLYGQKHGREVACAKTRVDLLGLENHLVLDLNLLRPLFASSALVAGNIETPSLEEVMGNPQPLTYVPNRNMIFLALAAAYAETCGVDVVYYGAQRHDMYGYWDTTAEFLEQLNRVYQLNRNKPIRIEAPFVDKSKTDLLSLGLGLEVDYGKTWSCYEGAQEACDRCPTCAERLKAFADLGLQDPVPYQKRET